jgi:hypothetical protein
LKEESKRGRKETQKNKMSYSFHIALNSNRKRIVKIVQNHLIVKSKLSNEGTVNLPNQRPHNLRTPLLCG